LDKTYKELFNELSGDGVEKIQFYERDEFIDKVKDDANDEIELKKNDFMYE
jgi:hypothetical protein